jgi:hypothetical protein
MLELSSERELAGLSVIDNVGSLFEVEDFLQTDMKY